MSEPLKTTSKLVPAARKEGDALVASINGEIDLNNSPELRAALLGLLEVAKLSTIFKIVPTEKEALA